MRDVTAVLTQFVRTLRHAGLDVPAQRVTTFLNAVGTLDVASPRDTYWAGRVTLCGSREDLPVYDAAFAAFFGGVAPVTAMPRPAPMTRPRLAARFGAPDVSIGADETGVPVAVSASDAEILRHRDIAGLSATERDDVRRMIAMLAVGTATRPSRRFDPGRSGPVDRARTVRRLLHGGGEPARLERRHRRPKPRRLVLLIDVSGSMAPYADALLCFAYAASRRGSGHASTPGGARSRNAAPRTEVFTIGTRLTRVTRAMRQRDPDAALRAAGQTVADWHGGTRLAESIKAFLERWGRRGVARGAVVVVCSDGWERGDPGPLAEQVAHLARLAHRLIWVNPHRGKPGYQPLAGGMAACLPYVDDLVSGHSVAALADLVDRIREG